MKKKYLLVIISLFTCLYNVAQTTFSDASGIQYTVITSIANAVVATDYTGSSTDLSIPATVTNAGIDYNVTSIGPNAFQSKQLTSLTIPSSVTSIGPSAFQSNQLTSLVIPSSITSIGVGAFSNNQLTSVSIPDSLTRIEIAAFFNNQLTSVTIPSTITGIGFNAFASNQLTNVTIPYRVTSIGSAAFNSNPLTSVTSLSLDPATLPSDAFSNRDQIDLTIPLGSEAAYIADDWTGFNSVTETSSFTTTDGIEYTVTDASANTVAATDYTGSSTDVSIPATVTNAGVTYSVTSIGRSAFASNQLTSVTIPNGVTRIEFAAFGDNQLTSLVIPSSVTSLGMNAFGLNPLTNVISLNMNPDVLGNAIVDATRANIDLTIPLGTSTAYTNASWTGFKSVTESSTIDGIQYTLTDASANTVAATDYLGSSTDVSIPATVTSAGTDYIVTSIGDSAFEDNSLTTLSLPYNVTSIGSAAFANNSLTSVTSSSVDPATLPSDAFSNRDQIDLVIPEGTEADYIAADWTGFKSVTEDATLSSEDLSISNAITLFPNPSNAFIQVAGLSAKGVYTIYNLLGAEVKSGTISKREKIDVSALTNGVYYVQLNNRTTIKFIKE